MEEILFNKNEMCKYISGFDSTAKKYDISPSSQNYHKALEYDNCYKSINLKKATIHNMIDNTNLIYGNFQQSIDYGMIYENVLNKFLLNFVSVQGLGSLYDTQYMDFEWNMHSNLNFEKHTNSYYRDHFIHQVRNMFMVLRLVDNEYIFHNVNRVLTTSTRGKVAQYFNNRLDAWLNSIGNNKSLNDLLDGISKEKSQSEYYRYYFSNYVIRASLIIGCLFHDIGYPVAYYLSVKERLINFIPAVYSIMGDNNFDFNYIYSILSESVLFQFVGKEDIYRRFNKNDHGTISAILVGIFFYKTGLIHSLPIEKQTAVELGILAIYNHTLALKKCTPKANTDYIKMQFALNPISYILRWCDDMQEWDREYFEIASVPNLLFCSKCKMPLRRERMTSSKYFKENNMIWDEETEKKLDKDPSFFRGFFSYRCMCNSDYEYSYTKRDDFTRRKLIQIKACDNVILKMNDDLVDGKILIDFQYNLYKLLRLSNFHPSFIKKRQEEIVVLKKFVEGQRFIKGQRGYQYICINHNLSPNPILLKTFILKEFLDITHEYVKSVNDGKSCFSNFELLKEIDEIHDIIITKLDKAKLKDFTQDFKSLADRIFELCYGKSWTKGDVGIIKYNCKKYIALMVCQKICLKQSNINNRKYVCKVFKPAFSKLKKDDIRKVLVNNAFEQIKNAPDLREPSKTVVDDGYYKYLSDDKYFFTVVSGYCDLQNDINCIEPNGEKLTYYTDLYLFEQLSYLTELLKKINKTSYNDPPNDGGVSDGAKEKSLIATS